MRKSFFVIAVMAILFSACGDKPDKAYTISGTLPAKVDAKWVYLYSLNAQEPRIIDSVAVTNGQFSFKGNTPDSVVLALVHPGSVDEYPALSWELILEPGAIVIDSASQFASGTPTNDGIRQWMDEIYSIMRSAPEPNALKDNFRQRWADNCSSFVGPFMLASMAVYFDFPFVDSLASQVPAEMKNVSILKPFFDQVEAMRRMQPGNMFTDVDLATVDGTPAKLSDYVGKGTYLLVDFWASWCGPCRQAMPELQSVVKKHKELTVLGIAVSDKIDDTKKAIADLKITWTVLSDPEGNSAKAYGVNAIPAMILFAPDGTIVARDFMPANIDDLLATANSAK